MVKNNEINFYKRFGKRTKFDSKYSKFFSGDIKQIVGQIQDLMIHIGEVKFRGLNSYFERFEELNNKSVEDILNKIEEEKSKSFLDNEKILSICRHFSMVLAGILKSKGIFARCRCGFATYFKKNWFEDHWICEYWSLEEKRWIQVDSQLNSWWKKQLGVVFNNLDLPKGKFFSGAEIWKLYREGKINPDKCGFSLKENSFGEWYIRGNMLRDFFALNNFEYLYDEKTKFMDKNYICSKRDLKLLDKIADLILNVDSNFDNLRNFYLRRKDLRPIL